MADTTATTTLTDIAVTRHERWIEIEIRRPEKFNALREQTAAEIMDTMADAEMDDSITSVLLSGNAKAFCSGIDTSEFEVAEGRYFDFYRKRKRTKRFSRLYRELPQYTKPVICAIEGVALGGGLADAGENLSGTTHELGKIPRSRVAGSACRGTGRLRVSRGSAVGNARAFTARFISGACL